MSLRAATAALALVLGQTSAINRRQNENTTCTDIHVMISRGTTESYPGTLRSLTDLVLDAYPGTNYEDIIYPATSEDTTPSYHEGIVNATNQLTAYASSCPDSRILVLGYSQGAMVVGDMLAGGGGNSVLGNITLPTIDPQGVGSHIAALLMYGDPRHMPNQTYNDGMANTIGATGKYPRTTAMQAVLANYADRFRDFCNFQDGVCDASGSNLSAHIAYAQWDATAFAWLETTLG